MYSVQQIDIHLLTRFFKLITIVICGVRREKVQQR